LTDSTDPQPADNKNLLVRKSQKCSSCWLGSSDSASLKVSTLGRAGNFDRWRIKKPLKIYLQKQNNTIETHMRVYV
jgi:hypothetical protein